MRKRNIRISVRLNEKEYTHLVRQSQHTGLKFEPLLRCLITGLDLKPRAPAEWPELVRQVSAIGNNINQLVRVANSERSVSHETLCEMQRHQAAVWEVVKKL